MWISVVYHLVLLFLLVPSSPSQPFEPLDRQAIRWPDQGPPTQALIDLGRHLFFDPRLVENEQQSCASCHQPQLAYSDGLALSVQAHKGWQPAKRTAPSLYNVAWAPVLQWDGRISDGQCFVPEDTKQTVCLPALESQAFQSMQSRQVYTGFLPKIKQVKAYQTLFQQAFPPDGEITHVRMARAIAAFERTLVSDRSPFDRYLQGDKSALSPAAKHGLELFSGKAGCIACHSGALLTDWGFHHIGLQSHDAGRGEHVKTAEEKQRFHRTFRTPPLRNVGLTAPYMHDGSLGSLEAVVAFYDRGGDDATHRPPLIHPLGLTPHEQAALVAFLESLTEVRQTETSVRPGR
jgi:cytochrome c peroxidase